MVTLVRPKSMFLKCLNVTDRPATIAGKYNRSRQFNLGRGTVTAMNSSTVLYRVKSIRRSTMAPGIAFASKFRRPLMVYTVHRGTRLFSGDRIAPPETSKAGEVGIGGSQNG